MGIFISVLTGFYIVINVTGYIIMGVDKAKSIRKERRIPERVLFRIAMFGGAVGIYIGMRKFRHKTKHATFTWGIPLICIVHGGLLAALIGLDS